MATLTGTEGSINNFAVGGTTYDDFGFRYEFDYRIALHDVSRFGDLDDRFQPGSGSGRARLFFHSDDSVVNKLPTGATVSLELYQKTSSTARYWSGTFMISGISSEVQRINGAPRQVSIYDGVFTVTSSGTRSVAAT